jgi:colanic acid biosynthesis glycosyl transferase WcaI
MRQPHELFRHAFSHASTSLAGDKPSWQRSAAFALSWGCPVLGLLAFARAPGTKRNRCFTMRIVLLNQFYVPDVAPTGLYLHDLARSLVRRGHDVTVIASRHAYGGGGEYPERELVEGVHVRRLAGSAFGRGTVPGKLADYAAYYVGLAARIARSIRPDLVVSLTTPPYLGLVGKYMAEVRGAQHAHWVMDVYPDVMSAHGLVKGAPLQALASLARLAHTGAHAVATLGPAMATRLRDYTPESVPITWVPLWAPEALQPWPVEKAVPLRAERGWAQERLWLLYSGNLGLGHRFDELLQAALRLGVDGPGWAFAGGGRRRLLIERFVAAHPELPIELHPYAPEARLREHLCSADVHLVTMESAWEGALLPSKLQASFAVGKPVIFVGRPNLDMSRWIAESEGGWVVNEGDVNGLVAAVQAAQNPDERARRGRNGRAFAERTFDSSRNLDALIAALIPC